jgi:hypothetical protein
MYMDCMMYMRNFLCREMTTGEISLACFITEASRYPMMNGVLDLGFLRDKCVNDLMHLSMCFGFHSSDYIAKTSSFRKPTHSY